ncbi:MAG: alpha-L-fucosidase [bacterium]
MVTTEERLQWWRQARFGMFIHWGLYAIPAGIWKGKEYDGIGEWIMHHAQIPVKEYEKLAREFNPVNFNADNWVRLADKAGMKYLTITAKHHDGFAMYDSEVSDYNIVDATPFKKDPMKELARACKEAGIKLCFYYSQDQDWHHPDASGNDWDFDPEEKNFENYFENKVKPQVRELLTNYGPIGMIWFDTPISISEEQSEELTEFVHELQPDCLVNGRVGHDKGDYGNMGDNQIPENGGHRDWETPATMNDTWGYKTTDENWKSTRTLIHLLADIVSKGGNYLLNVGPTAEGIIPHPSIERLADMGEWMKVNGASIYGATANPLGENPDWGVITAKPDRLYLHVFDWKEKIQLSELEKSIKQSYLLADNRQKIQFKQKESKAEFSLPKKAPDQKNSVIVVELE